jgi:hypothetical protein
MGLGYQSSVSAAFQRYLDEYILSTHTEENRGTCAPAKCELIIAWVLLPSQVYPSKKKSNNNSCEWRKSKKKGRWFYFISPTLLGNNNNQKKRKRHKEANLEWELGSVIIGGEEVEKVIHTNSLKNGANDVF